jgi:adenylosuccinate synthase
LTELKICTGYQLNGKLVDLLPMGADEVADCLPVFETLSGWSESTVGANTMEALPAAARAYLARIEALCEVPIDIVSTGPERDETILRRHPFA